MTVIAASEIHGQAASSDKQLKTALSQWLDSPPRRIDRMILQALLCSAPLKARVRSDCGLYLASRHPARATMGALLDAAGLRPDQIVKVPTVLPSSGRAFASGRADVVITAEPWASV